MDLSLIDFYWIGRVAVQLYPQNLETPCLQPQAFRVLQMERGSEIGTENLGVVPTDKDTPFFWSRKWHQNKYSPNALEYGYPLVTMYEIIGETQSSPFTNGFKRCYTIEISVLDIKRQDCADCDQDCNDRPINQIFLDTGTILDSILLYYGGMVRANTSIDLTPKLYSRPWLDNEKSRGMIDWYEVKHDVGASLNAANPNLRFTRVERPTQQIYGTKTQVRFCTNNCPSITYDNVLEDFGTVAGAAGCKNC